MRMGSHIQELCDISCRYDMIRYKAMCIRYQKDVGQRQNTTQCWLCNHVKLQIRSAYASSNPTPSNSQSPPKSSAISAVLIHS